MKKLLFLLVIAMIAFTTILCPGKKGAEGDASVEEGTVEEGQTEPASEGTDGAGESGESGE